MKGILGESGPRPTCLPVASVQKKKKKKERTGTESHLQIGRVGQRVALGSIPSSAGAFVATRGEVVQLWLGPRPFLQQRAGAQALISEVTVTAVIAGRDSSEEVLLPPGCVGALPYARRSDFPDILIS